MSNVYCVVIILYRTIKLNFHHLACEDGEKKNSVLRCFFFFFLLGKGQRVDFFIDIIFTAINTLTFKWKWGVEAFKKQLFFLVFCFP